MLSHIDCFSPSADSACAFVAACEATLRQAPDAALPADALGAPAPLPGAVERRLLGGDPALAYFIYVPRSVAPGARLFVSVHGISRNARQHARLFAPFAERCGVVVVAPRFDRERFPSYQRLGRNARGEDPVELLERIVAEASRLTAADSERLYLFGYSGGGQFVHRYVFAHPERVAAYAIGAAGWYTFPDPRRRYPYGIRRNVKRDVGGFAPQRFLPVPGCVLVGERDAHRGTALRSTERLIREQGDSRLERGARWAEAMNAAARELGMPPRIDFETLPRSPHSFQRSMRRGGMGERVFHRLFGLSGDDAGAVEVYRIEPG